MPQLSPHDLQRIAVIAAMLGVTSRTIRNYISRGILVAYRIPGTRGVLLDRAEVMAAMRMIPATVARPGVAAFGPNARIVDLPPQPRRAEVVPPKNLHVD